MERRREESMGAPRLKIVEPKIFYVVYQSLHHDIASVARPVEVVNLILRFEELAFRTSTVESFDERVHRSGAIRNPDQLLRIGRDCRNPVDGLAECHSSSGVVLKVEDPDV